MVLETLACSVSPFSWQRIKLSAFCFFPPKLSLHTSFQHQCTESQDSGTATSGLRGPGAYTPPQALGMGHLCPAQLQLCEPGSPHVKGTAAAQVLLRTGLSQPIGKAAASRPASKISGKVSDVFLVSCKEQEPTQTSSSKTKSKIKMQNVQ